ncbi:MAG: twin-arginine translocase subunit TatC [Chloroflexota bacterium]
MSIPTDDTRAITGSTPPDTNGTGAHASDSANLTHPGETVQATSSATDGSVAPAPYEPALPPASPPPPDVTNALEPSDGAPEDEEEGMTMLEHLEELRARIVVCSVALVVGLAISAIPIPYLTESSVTQTVISIVSQPAAGHLIFFKPGEGFITYFQVAMLVAIVLALPVITYQAIAFVLPALLPHEKKYLYMAVPGAMISFAIGLLFGYVLVIPVAIQFLLTFGVDNIPGLEVKWAFSEYIGTVTTLLFWMGLSFETPLLMFFLTKLRILNPDRLRSFRKYALIVAFIIGAMITPTPDPLNQTLVSLPLYLLFELGLLLSRLA